MGLFSKEACEFCATEVGMLKRSKLASKEFICNDCKTAYKLIHLLESKNINVPQDVSVVAFDEGLFAEIGTPKLTTFTVDYIKMAEMGAESIVLKLEDNSFHLGKKVINGHVISRDSVSKKQKWSTIPLY